MTHLTGRRSAGIASFLGLVSAAWTAHAATITPLTNFGSNPTGIGMYLYTPTNVVAKPPILVGIHACHGKGLDVCNTGHPFAQQADKYGFLMICPSAVSSDQCWDVHSKADLTHNGGGDAEGILSAVTYVVQNKNGDATRVYAAGHSSGGMMTNVLLGSYPDVFKAGVAFAGVPFACFAQGSVDSLGWSSTCANGNVTMTGAQWGALVSAAYPTFTGPRPRIQVWHGTADTILLFHNFGEEIKQWTNVLGASETPVTTENNAVQSTWIRTRYTDSTGLVRVEAIQETGQPHNLVINGAEAIHFLGLDGSAPLVIGSGGGSGVGGATGAGGATGVGGSTSAAGATSTGGRSGAGGATAAAGRSGVAGSSDGGGASSSTSGAGGSLGVAGTTGTDLGGAANSSGGMPAAGSPGTAGTSAAAAGSSSTSGPGAGASGSDAPSSSGCALANGAPSGFAMSRLAVLMGLAFMGWRRRRNGVRVMRSSIAP